MVGEMYSAPMECAALTTRSAIVSPSKSSIEMPPSQSPGPAGVREELK
jgi:hypothetical protein